MASPDRRVVVTVLVSVVGAALGIGGAGHAYLRQWGRAFAWFSLVLGVGLVLVGSFADPETASVSTLPLRVVLPVAVLLALNTVDAYRVARGATSSTVSPAPTADGETVPCPECGRELDPDLSFCPWCAGSRAGDRTEKEP